MKDPFQGEATPYEVLSVGSTATVDDVDRAFKDGLIRRLNVQKLTSAKRALQDPIARAIVDLFIYDDRDLAALDPNPLADPAALQPPRRWATLGAWQSQFRERVMRDSTSGQTDGLPRALAVAWYWSGLYLEKPTHVAGEPLPRDAWEMAIAFWAAVLAGNALARESRGDEIRGRVLDRLRNTIRECGLEDRSPGGIESDASRKLEDLLDVEVRIAGQFAAVTRGATPFGPLMLTRLGLLDAARSWIADQRRRTPGDERVRALEELLSPYAPVHALLAKHRPEAALELFDGLPDAVRRTGEGRDVRAQVLQHLGRQRATLEQFDEALRTWEEAIQGAGASRGAIAAEIAACCTARAAALQGRDREKAEAVLERGLAILARAAAPGDSAAGAWARQKGLVECAGCGATNRLPADPAAHRGLTCGRCHAPLAVEAVTPGAADDSIAAARESIELTLAEILAQNGIVKANQALDAADQASDLSPELLARLAAAVAMLDRAASLGSARAVEQAAIAHTAVGRTRWRFRKSRTIDFNELPPAIRHRLVLCMGGAERPKPFLKVPVSGAGRAIFFGVLGAFVALSIASDGYGGFDGVYQPASAMFLYAAALLPAAFAGVSIVRNRRLRSLFPFDRGRYIFPLDVIDATTGAIRVLSLRELEEFKPVHHFRNGVYTQSSLTFKWPGQRAETFIVAGQAQADAIIKDLNEWDQAARKFIEVGDIAGLRQFDPLYDLSMSEAAPGLDAGAEAPVVRTLPRALERKWLTSVAVAAVLAPLVWLPRNLLSDEALFAGVKASQTRRGYQMYTGVGWRHVAEARAALPKLAFKEAKETNTVTAFRTVIRDFPQSPEAGQAREQIHLIFASSWAKFRRDAPKADPAVVDFLRRMLVYLEQHGAPTLQVRFRSADAEALRAADRRYEAQAAGRVAPIAEHFDEASNNRREATIVSQLSAGFSSIFPGDVLHPASGPRLSQALASAPASASPDILIQYTVTPSGDFYSLRDQFELPAQGDTNRRLFTGIAIAFTIAMRIPQEAPLRFDLNVEPPTRFTVRTQSSVSQADDQSVYDTMAERAFDQLADKLKAVFFGAPRASE